MSWPHTPIMVEEIKHFFAPQQIRLFVDGTLGAGGHAAAILEAHPEIHTYMGFDQDQEALSIAKKRLAPFGDKVEFIESNFRYMDDYIEDCDACLLDVGVSSMQLDQEERGFSFYKEGPLDMRMDPNAPLTAAKVVNTYSEKELGTLFKEYGEERRWRAAARALVAARNQKRLKTTTDLCDALKGVIPWRGRKGHPLTLIFQALRIEVNDELGALKEGVKKGIALLNPGGRIGVLSFHSLEDRMVKNAFKEEQQLAILTKKPLQASEDEIKKNPRARSAKLRFGEKKACPLEH